MSETFELTEYRSSLLPISDADARWLAGLGSGRFQVAPNLAGEGWWVSPGPTVGVIDLPCGDRLRCHPKAPVRNVFYMLSTVHEFRSPFMEQSLAFAQIDELFEFLVEHLANLIDLRLQNGLYRAYLEREENLTAVRGRIVIADDLRRNAILRHRTYCQFTELTWDIPENRVIRQTVFAMSRLVRRPALQQRLAALDRELGEIDPTPLPLSVFDTFNYHRLNDDYRPIHRLCRLLLASASVSEHAGEIGFRAFLLDMNRLYEEFLSIALRDAIAAPLELIPQRERRLDMDALVTIRPDLTLMRHGQTAVIGDAKYKLASGPTEGHHDLYQMLAYCTAEGIRHGVLIYPRWEGASTATVRVRNSPVEIARLTIDLGGAIEEVQREIHRLALQLSTWAHETASSKLPQWLVPSAVA